jgi:Cu2+-exporting ATPase
MFTLIGIGTEWHSLQSNQFFPRHFPAEFKTESGTVSILFEATAVILTLVLLGQLLKLDTVRQVEQ